MCDACRPALDLHGHVTVAGHQIQQNLQVPTVYPGRVVIEGEEKAPAMKKWAGVNITDDCEVKYDEVLISQERVRLDDKGKRYVKMTSTDIEHLRARSTRRWAIVLAGISCSGARPMVSAQTAYNQAKALLGRAFRRSLVQARPGIWQWATRFNEYLLGDGFHQETMTAEEWLASMPSARRIPLARALERYRRSGWKKGYGGFKAFVKTERLPGFSKLDEPILTRDVEMLDRLIQGPSDEAHCIVGPELKPFMGQLKEKWTTESQVFYGSVGPEKLNEWLNKTLLGTKLGVPSVPESKLFFWCDYAMYDNTHSDQTWDFMEQLYWDAGIRDPDFWKVMKAWRRPAGKIGPFKYTARVMNASGRDDTALANGVLNGYACLLSACAAYLQVPLTSLTPEQVKALSTEIRISVCGDDSLGCLPLMSPERLQRFSKDMVSNIAAFGFEAKLDYSDRVHDAVYLGQVPMPTAAGWIFGKTIGRSTYKMGFTEVKAARDHTAVMKGIAEMHRKTSRHVPILYDLAAKICELTAGMKELRVTRDETRPWEWSQDCGADYDDATLEFVAEMFTHRNRPLCSIQRPCEIVTTVEDLKRLQKDIAAVEMLPAVIDSEVWRRLIWMNDL